MDGQYKRSFSGVKLEDVKFLGGGGSVRWLKESPVFCVKEDIGKRRHMNR